MLHIKKDFPLLVARQKDHFTYLDNAATTHKPQQVLDALMKFYGHDYATVGRSMYALAERATEAVEQSRYVIASFIGASAEEIIFTSGATESINLIAERWALEHIRAGDSIVLSEQEHHSNLVPWLEVAKKTGAVIRYIPIADDGSLNLNNIEKIIDDSTKFVAITAISNALGLKNDCAPIINRAHAVGAKILIDASQAIAHEPINIGELKPDFLVFSGHKILGPTGIGVLYIARALHDAVAPYKFGGGMVYEADYERASFMKAPHKFEAGTPPIAEIIGLAAAITYFKTYIPFDALKKHEAALMGQLLEGLQRFKKVKILGPIDQLKNGSIVSFTVADMHPHDVAAFLDQHGIAVRAGHYCAQPLAKKLGIDGSVRVSIFGYNMPEDIAYLLEVMTKLLG